MITFRYISSYVFLAAFMLLAFSVQAEGVGQNSLDITLQSSDQICFEDRVNYELVLAVKNNYSDTLQTPSPQVFLSETPIGNGVADNDIASGAIGLIRFNNLGLTVAGVYSYKIIFNSNGGDINDTSIIELTVLPKLESSFIQDSTVCDNVPVTVLAEQGFTSYAWSNGAASRQVTLSNQGLYKVTVTNALGCEAIDTVIIDYYDIPTALAPGDTTICKGEILSASVNPVFSSVVWSDGTTGNSILIADSGWYTVDLVDQDGCMHSDSFQVTYHNEAAPGLIGNVTMCEGDTMELSANPGFHSYGWSNGDNSSSIIVTTTGMYTVTVMGPEGCVGYDTANVLVSPLPEISFSDSLMCNNLPLLVDVGVFDTYEWNTGDSTSYNLISQPGIYVVTVVDYSGCVSTDSIAISNVDVAVDLGNDTTICEGTALFAQISNTYDHISWDNGDTNSYHFIGSNGTHVVTVYVQGCQAQDEITVVEDPVPFPDFDVQVVSPMITLENYSNSNNCTWFFGDGNMSNLFEPQHAYSVHGNFDVTLMVETACGVDSLTKQVGIFPQAIGHVGQGENIKVYPTLTSSEISFTISDVKYNDCKYVVYDASGKQVLNGSYGYSSAPYALNVTHLAAGQYYLGISIEDEVNMFTTTFIKQ